MTAARLMDEYRRLAALLSDRQASDDDTVAAFAQFRALEVPAELVDLRDQCLRSAGVTIEWRDPQHATHPHDVQA
jgi:hypothetical protein